MKKKYNLSEENERHEDNILREPVPAYGYRAVMDMEFSPPLTEEELENSLTGEELIESLHKFIDELFDKDENSLR